MSRKQKLEHVSSIPKDDAQRIMSQKGYPCRVVDGVLTFEDIFGSKDIMVLQKGITVRELAEKSNTTQIPMSRFITGARMPNAPILKNIAKALETTTDYLLGGDQE